MHNSVVWKVLGFVLPLIWPISAQGCVTALNEPIHQPAPILIQQTQKIVLARFVKQERQGKSRVVVVNHFETIENLKGKTRKYFSSESYEVGDYTAHHSSNHHTDPAFWQHYTGRFGYADESCTRPIPKFVPGKLYLLFLGSEDSKAYELIEDPSQDKWYQYVKARLAASVRR